MSMNGHRQRPGITRAVRKKSRANSRNGMFTAARHTRLIKSPSRFRRPAGIGFRETPKYQCSVFAWSVRPNPSVLFARKLETEYLTEYYLREKFESVGLKNNYE